MRVIIRYVTRNGQKGSVADVRKGEGDGTNLEEEGGRETNNTFWRTGEQDRGGRISIAIKKKEPWNRSVKLKMGDHRGGTVRVAVNLR